MPACRRRAAPVQGEAPRAARECRSMIYFKGMSEDRTHFATVEEAVEEIRQGRMIVLVDDEDRENEGDLAMAAEKITPEAINFMSKYGRGLICLTLTEQR